MQSFYCLAEELDVYSNNQDAEPRFWKDKFEDLLLQNQKLEEDLKEGKKVAEERLAELLKAHEELKVEYDRLEKEDTQDILQLKEECNMWKTGVTFIKILQVQCVSPI